MASFNLKYTFASLPRTVRGQFIQVNGDPKGQNFLYCNGNQVYIRDIKNTAVCDVYAEHSKETTVAKYSPSRFYIASGDKEGKVRVWDTVNKEHILKKEHHLLGGAVKCVDWTQDNSKICAVGDGKEVFGKVVSFDAGTTCGEIIGQSKSINCAGVKQTRPFRIATGSEDFTSAFFEGPPFKFKCSKTDHTNFVNCLKYAADGTSYVTGGADGMLFQYDGKTSELIGHFGEGKAHKGGIYAICFSPDDKKLLSVSGDKTAKIWDVASRTEETIFEMGKDIVDMQVGCVWEKEAILTVSLSGYINFLDPANPSQPSKIVKGHNKPVIAAALTPDASQFYTASSDGRIIRWDAATSENDDIKGKGHSNQVNELALDGDYLISVGFDDTIRFTQASSMQYSDSIKLDSQPKGVDSKKGITVVACLNHITVFEVPNKKLSSLSVNFEALCVSMHPSGNEVAIGCKTCFIIFSVNGGALAETKKVDLPDVNVVQYSPDGKWLAAASGKKVKYYDLDNWKECTGGWDEQHTARVTSLAWSPDSNKLVSSAIDSYLIMWQHGKIEGKKPAVKAHPLSHINKVAWLDNHTVMSCGQDSNIKIWSVSE